ncbi:MAG: NAD-dependent epimerase/dehydratase family protein [Xanthomonadaceae bacterium]|nr:NAD-dependent epimerase/dehydratase family protein [Xanthomonadaceae bacterium]
MRALVIGGNGFIGSHLAEGLRVRGHDVRVLDPGQARADVDWTGIDYRRGAYTDAASIADALDDVDTVFHLASTTVPASSNRDPAYDVSSNLVGALGLLSAMQARGLRRIVFFSSGGTVYGDPEVLPVPESHPLKPISSYGIVKVAIEQYLSMYRHLGQLDPLVLRPSNPFGPRQSAAGGQGFVAAAIARLHEGAPLQIWGDGETVRDYIFIDDLVELAIRAAASGDCGIFNAGSGVGASLNDIRAAIERAAGRKMSVEHLPARGFDVRRVVLDVSAARERFDWSPAIDLADGIARTWQASLNP